jgi:pimeloyl-ACP methyl ester carboxylesterase
MSDSIISKPKDKSMLAGILQRLSVELPTLLQVAHWAARGVFRGMGYHWELHRNGEQKIGYWRIKFREKSQGQSYPKRFVLIPGFGDTALSWQASLTLLNPIFRQEFDELILLDLPGFAGFLFSERSFVSLDLMMVGVNDVLDYLKPHTILAHSLGGWLASHYAALCGEGKRPVANRLNYSGPQSLILINPSGIYGEEKIREELEAVFKRAIQNGFSVLRPHLFAREPFWFRYVEDHFQRIFKKEDIAQLVSSVKAEHALQGGAAQIQSQIWLIWGEKDSLVPPTCVEAWMSFLNPEFSDRHHAIFLKNLGHCPHLEGPVATTALIGQILKNRVPLRMGQRWWEVIR